MKDNNNTQKHLLTELKHVLDQALSNMIMLNHNLESVQCLGRNFESLGGIWLKFYESLGTMSDAMDLAKERLKEQIEEMNIAKGNQEGSKNFQAPKHPIEHKDN